MRLSNRFFRNNALWFAECRHTLHSDRHYRAHRHAQLSIGAVIEGVVAFENDGYESILQPQTLIVINPEVVHSCNPIENQSRSYYMLYLDAQWCTQMQKTLFKGVTKFVPIAPVLIRDTSIYELFLDVCSALLDPEMLLLEKEERLERFVRVLFREYSAWDDLCLRTDQINTDPRIQQAQQYMRENLHRDLSVSEIAHHVGISPFYFTRSFRNSVGIPPHAYHLNLRIDRAKELLSTDMPIAQIALEVGFSDQSHLNRVFKKITACTPYEYVRGKIE